MLSEWQSRLEKTVITRGAGGDGSHDLGHCRRVWQVCRQIADALEEPSDRLVLLAASYLHDIVSLEKNDPRRSQASQMAGEEARFVLSKLDFPAEKLESVIHAIEAHSFSAGIEPLTIEAKILQDADRMECLGAIGLARIFYVGGRMGTKLFDENDPFAEDRPLDDLSYSLDHFYTKVLRLPELMKTAPGRAIATERMRIMRSFLTCLTDEIGVDQTGVDGATSSLICDPPLD